MNKIIPISAVALIILAIIGGVAVYQKNSRGKSVKNSNYQINITQPVNPTTAYKTTENNSFDTIGLNSSIPLTISSPASNSATTVPNAIIKGTTKPNSEVLINDNSLKADAKGNFSANITLEEGDNSIVVTVVDEDGNSAEKEITVTYTPSQ